MKQKLKRIFKRTIPLILVCSLTIGAVLGHNTKEAKALTGVEEAALVTAILLAYGYVTTRYFNDTDGANALKNDMEQAYEDARFKVLNGGASGGNGDEDPDDNDFEDTDGDGKITEKDIPQFKDISLPGKAAFALSANVTTLLSPIIGNFLSDRFGQKNEKSNHVDINTSRKLESIVLELCQNEKIDLSSYNSSVKWWDGKKSGRYDSSYPGGVDRYKVFNYWYGNNANLEIMSDRYYIRDGKLSNGFLVRVKLHDDGKVEKNIEVPRPYNSCAVMFNYSYISINVPYLYNDKSSIVWTTPELRDNFDPHGKLDLIPQFDPNFAYNMPSAEALQQLLQNLITPSLSTEQQNQLLLDYINNLKNEPINKPEPNPEPNPDPNPEPNPEPNPDPSPDPSPEPNPDESEDNGKFTADLKTLFPFCIPFDLVDCFKLFNAEPETPRIEVPMHFGIIDVDYTWVIDLKDFDSVAVICRSMFLILFLIGLALATSKVIKW